MTWYDGANSQVRSGVKIFFAERAWCPAEPQGVSDRVRHEAMAGQHPRPAGAAADAVVGGVEVDVAAAVRNQVRRVPGGGEQLR